MTRHLPWLAGVICIGCGSKPAPQEPSTTIVAAPAPSDAAAAPVSAAPPPDRCDKLVRDGVEDATWFVNEYGLLDYVDIDRLPAVIREQCKTYTDAELACMTPDPGPKPVDLTGCVPPNKLAAMRSAMLPLLDYPADLKEAARITLRCDYGDAMRAMAACKAVPERMRRKLERAWSVAINPPLRNCGIGATLMKQRLAAIGCK